MSTIRAAIIKTMQSLAKEIGGTIERNGSEVVFSLGGHWLHFDLDDVEAEYWEDQRKNIERTPRFITGMRELAKYIRLKTCPDEAWDQLPDLANRCLPYKGWS